jgi:hypothetical protein
LQKRQKINIIPWHVQSTNKYVCHSSHTKYVIFTLVEAIMKEILEIQYWTQIALQDHREQTNHCLHRILPNVSGYVQ